LAVLAEIGIQHTGRSKVVDEFRGMVFDLVVTLCDSAEEECPTWVGNGKRAHQNFSDPAKTNDLNDFRKVRDAMMQDIIALLEAWGTDPKISSLK
jgi:arsenate reductase